MNALYRIERRARWLGEPRGKKLERAATTAEVRAFQELVAFLQPLGIGKQVAGKVFQVY